MTAVVKPVFEISRVEHQSLQSAGCLPSSTLYNQVCPRSRHGELCCLWTIHLSASWGPLKHQPGSGGADNSIAGDSHAKLRRRASHHSHAPGGVSDDPGNDVFNEPPDEDYERRTQTSFRRFNIKRTKPRSQAYCLIGGNVTLTCATEKHVSRCVYVCVRVWASLPVPGILGFVHSCLQQT